MSVKKMTIGVINDVVTIAVIGLVSITDTGLTSPKFTQGPS
jgi:hypothetical protein